MPISRARPTTSPRASLSSPQTSTSQSGRRPLLPGGCAATFWKRRHDLHPRAERRLRRHRGRALRRELHACDPRRHQRHCHVHDDLALDRVAHRGHGRRMNGIGNRQNHDRGGRRGAPHIGAADPRVGRVGEDVARLGLGAGGVARSDHHLVADARPACRERAALLSRPAQHRENFPVHRRSHRHRIAEYCIAHGITGRSETATSSSPRKRGPEPATRSCPWAPAFARATTEVRSSRIALAPPACSASRLAASPSSTILTAGWRRRRRLERVLDRLARAMAARSRFERDARAGRRRNIARARSTRRLSTRWSPLRGGRRRHHQRGGERPGRRPAARHPAARHR